MRVLARPVDMNPALHHAVATQRHLDDLREARRPTLPAKERPLARRLRGRRRLLVPRPV
jgi:hypothetical protein